MAKKNSNVVREAAFLMAAQMICSVIGLIYRSPMHLIIGDIGDGYYQYAYEWYAIILLLSSYSIPSALSKVMADRLAKHQYRNAQKVFYASIAYVLVVGGIGALAAFFGAPFFLSRQPDAVLALRILAPTIVLAGLLGCLRGYFQAYNTMGPTGVSRIAEQIMNAFISVFAAWIFTRPFAGNESLVGKLGAAGGTLGTGAGVLAGILYMLYVYSARKKRIDRNLRMERGRKTESYRKVFKVIILMVTPIIFATGIYNCTAIIDQSIFTWIMDKKGVDPREVTRQYALFSYRVKPILNIPISLSSATSTALIPAVATAISKKRAEEATKKINECIQLSMFLAVPAAIGLIILSYPVIFIMYPTGDIKSAAVLLSLGAVSVIFYSLSTVTNGVLQGLGHPGEPVRNAAFALGINILSAVILLTFTDLGVYGILIATVLYAFAVMFLNARSLKKYFHYKHDMKRIFFQPLRAALVMGGLIGILYWVPAFLFPKALGNYIVNAVLTLAVVACGILVYIVLYTTSTRMTNAEIRKLPFGSKIFRLLKMLRVR
ncbi:MAG: polysaccharide biosynthesis protein [Lachnospiraceae bacterium]|nr:polysaccharide biosynthesis protein [Lachnospiraceae bacterium]